VVVRGGGFLEIALVDLRGLDEHVPMCTFFFEKVSASPLSTWVPRPKSPGAVFHCCYIWLGLVGHCFYLWLPFSHFPRSCFPVLIDFSALSPVAASLVH
jgi:hypothetical protein